MRATNSPRPARRGHLGFTLIELLVVISIIGILMGLLLGGVQKVREVGKRTTVVSDINQLDMAASKFKTDFGFNPPHRIRLPGVVPDSSWATGTTQQRESYAGFQQLLQMFPRWQLLVGGAASDPASIGKKTDIIFRGSSATQDANGLLLEGSQSMAFFLGGPLLKGFKPSGPYDPDPAPPAPTATSRKGPYFDFVVNRLNPSTDPKFLDGYLDPYGTPYAYFSASGSTSYDPSYAWAPPGVVNTDYAPNTPTAAPTLYLMRPYQDSTGKAINAGRIQIISAGKNKKFGPGTTGDFTAAGLVVTLRWVPGQKYYMLDATKDVQPGPPLDNGNGIGGDDLANFNGGAQLGASGN